MRCFGRGRACQGMILMILAPLGHGAPEEQPLCSCISQDSRRERSLHDVGSCAVAAVHDSPDWALRDCLAKLYKFTHPVSVYDLFNLTVSLLFSEPFQRESSIVLGVLLHSPVYNQYHGAVEGASSWFAQILEQARNSKSRVWGFLGDGFGEGGWPEPGLRE